ncbi:hypothetical protein LUZ63_014811 [Rhynchospora breviuscula]|uniref:Uncharacterized protein n=1 Tax=Rhynchospora breviuscula TaxID=2022672 RepID=A0A9Q0HLG3_9POAL|nr:hypothetical protein LUZ63_014811 [Rhynchospora breviuscula]
MAVGFVQAVSALLNVCSRHMSRAARSLTNPKKKKANLRDDNRRVENTNLNGEDGVWRKSIMMGEKCQPLNFSGVIYYDADGNKLDNVPPRSPMRSPLRTLGQHVTMLPVN